MYDQNKLNVFWLKRDLIRRNWKANGWPGPGHSMMRDLTYLCGCKYAVGYGISYSEVIYRKCFYCRVK